MDGRSPSKDERKASLSNLTRQYRESILRLTGTCDTCVAWQTSQHILDRLWEDNEKDDNSNLSVVYGCHTCGSLIHPGYMGTSLRVHRSAKGSKTRTLRRREQRKQKKQALAQQKQASDGNKRKAPQSDDYSTVPRLLLLADDDGPSLALDRHHLVIACGKCGTKIRKKGPGRRELPKASSETSKLKPGKKAEVLKKAVPTTNDDPSDFMQLPSLAKKPAPTLLQLQDAKKKKRKKKAPPKSNLINFLNSLND